MKAKHPRVRVTTNDAMKLGGIALLDAMADLVLAYRPKPKSAPAKERRKKRRKLGHMRSVRNHE